MSHKITILIIAVAIAIVVAIGALYEWLVPGLSSARTDPGPVETEVATWLLHRSVPAKAKARTNPLANDPAELAAGHDLFSQSVSRATVTTAVEKPRSVRANIRVRRPCNRWTCRRCRTARFFITS